MTPAPSTSTTNDARAEVEPAAAGATPLLTRGKRAVGALLATAVLAAVAALPASAEPAGGANHLVSATASADNPDVTRSGLQVASIGAPTVTSDNLARAVSHDCTGCRAAAAAFQAVFVTGNPPTIAPGNVAAAMNVDCTRCDSFAFAYQYVLTTNGPVYLSGTARQEIAALRQKIADTVASAAPDDQIDAGLHTLALQFKSIIDQDLTQAGVAARGSIHEHQESAPAGS